MVPIFTQRSLLWIHQNRNNNLSSTLVAVETVECFCPHPHSESEGNLFFRRVHETVFDPKASWSPSFRTPVKIRQNVENLHLILFYYAKKLFISLENTIDGFSRFHKETPSESFFIKVRIQKKKLLMDSLTLVKKLQVRVSLLKWELKNTIDGFSHFLKETPRSSTCQDIRILEISVILVVV